MVGGFVESSVDGQQDLMYTCKSNSEEPNEGIYVGANQGNVAWVDAIILNRHPWVTKGPYYLDLDREEKADIIWDKIISDDTIGQATPTEQFFTTNLKTVLDEWGDEFDCRDKTVHAQGNVAKARWVNLGGHNYTGMF